jgi:hypothetical protein
MSLRRLSAEHASIFGAPVLRTVDTRIFSLRYFTRCMACGFCNDQCCSYGVDIDAANAEKLLAMGEEFKAYVGVPASEWFTADLIEDAEFPSGRHRRTQTRGSYCVFHEPGGRGCKIHAWCLEHDLDYHLYKPMVSILFPLTFNHGCLEPSSEVLDGSLVCAGDGPSLYEGARGELEYYFGARLIAELETVRTAS